ncbi:MAG: rod shape-determining protein [Candidatus Kerfeldbacteria bacterium RIFCSPHIGHO2_02_FULL_42_14]|uniref:Cell shape-determining protein MreB n=1 Tax=Candidatus Kerfeldbacteria bacterium RIFCSPHIGHO2_02_FULL_42_14 TaxID=1798540 RepID=A0A1G2ASK5_9BACT|nr:MAG: rod shape-determining protein [Candidatus Kerfeldbacteria bacterium RIFCSPHIGHO2_02_FULL_42_14]OGY80654.1 MAG: rod shape-determining protein [Candidatus Kerfeldbacteria bacterium RIFCSPHIGHO2_12_FULL_42_13]OGY82579.1 MAG: rod shape-determining protein [Candidatus Kerfeldbacteria bacterium RIFCSPLOWO2_02_FULL_42_19]OGY85182.1 MAG: rod shape-determining protein [Candidatus Kerfeldbacteria bacterium RIFCSPLOWO2_12_FULL_43_9]
MGLVKNFFGRFSKDLGIDLGTANTLVYVKDKGIVINEPSVVAINERTGQILAVGQEAKTMIGRTPAHIIASRPLHDGVVSDFEVAEKMLKHFIEKVHRETFALLPRPRVVIGIPLGVTEVERKAVEDAVLNAGARQVFLIEEPMAAAIGARLPVQDATGSMVVDIGGGTTEIAVLALGGVVTWKSLRLAGDELNRNIMNYTRDKFNLLLGERTAEDVKISIGAAYEDVEMLETKMRGRDVITGLPREVTITSDHVREALAKSIRLFCDTIKDTVEETPPELVADVYERGILLTGGGALIRGLDVRIQKEMQIPVRVAEDPLTCVVRGTGRVLENFDALKDIFVLSTQPQS